MDEGQEHDQLGPTEEDAGAPEMTTAPVDAEVEVVAKANANFINYIRK